ncbi:MAG: hypothetical protein ACR2N3_18785 [Pyrinomonadaceae bacterium]
MKFHKKTALISIFCALPFMFLASWFWISAQKPSFYSNDLYIFGDAIFQLGFPLTTILYIFLLKIFGGNFTKESEIWALPLINFVFLIQWIIWSQLIVVIRRRFKKLS